MLAMDHVQVDSLLNKIEAHEASLRRTNEPVILDPGRLHQEPQDSSRLKTFWIDLFISEFLNDASDTLHDDLLFFVRKPEDQTANGSRRDYVCIEGPDQIELFRKDSKRMPIGDPGIDWKRTIYLNFILQNFNYQVVCAVCRPKSEDQLEIVHRHSIEVFASPSARHMCLDKAKNENVTYPDVYFTVENYEDFLPEVSVVDGEVVSVELIAINKRSSKKISLFIGSINHAILKKSFKSGRFMNGCSILPGSSRLEDVEFLLVRGPGNIGRAEIAMIELPSWQSRRAKFQNDSRRSLDAGDENSYDMVNVDYREIQVWPIHEKSFLSRNLNPYACFPMLKKAKGAIKHKRSMSEGNVAIDWEEQNCENIEIDDIKIVDPHRKAHGPASGEHVAPTCAEGDSSNRSNYLINPSGDDDFRTPSRSGSLVRNIRQALFLCRSKPPKVPVTGRPTITIGTYITNINMRWSHIIELIRSQRVPILI